MLLKTEYDEILTELFSRRAQEREKNLLEMQALLKSAGNPHLRFPTIHIAGTNGKGQTAVKIARALEATGLKVGLYTSPHLIDYTERITINGKNIPREKILAYFHVLETKPHFFNSTTLFAFRYFAEEEIDVAVVETGLGGKFDSTNVLVPLVSVITTIHYDHTHLLGVTLDEIAEQKAGIIKPGVPVVVGPRACYSPIFKRANSLDAPIHRIETRSNFFDEENRSVAKKVLELLKSHFPLDESHIERGLASHLPCRFERRGNVIYDAAHNPEGFYRLKQALQTHYPEEKFHFVIGMNREKDCGACLKIIEELAHSMHFVQAKGEGSASREELARLTSAPLSEKPPQEALTVVCGSFRVLSLH